jgi:hypothetical protein
MYVVRLKSSNGILNFRAFRSRTLALSYFESGESQVICEALKESALFDVALASDARAAIRPVRNGGVAVSRIYPTPMTQAQAAAWLAEFYL